MNDIKYKALLIGNSKFEEDPHNLLELKGPPNDIRSLEETLTHPQVGLHEPSNVQSLLNFSNWEIMEKLEEFFQNAKRTDQLLFYYSGHGRLDKYNNLYLCARNTKSNGLISTAIPDSAIKSMIENSASSRVLIILDCCYSGRFKGGGDIPQNLLGEGRFVITSSRSRVLSKDAEDSEGRSPFTKYLVQSLLSGEVDVNRDNYVSINEVYNYILPRLREETKQIPQRNYDGAVGELAIGKSIAAGNVTLSNPVQSELTKSAVSVKSERPILAVSESVLEINDVMPGERLPEEIIDVFNAGGGKLNWSVECNDDWIEIEKQKGFFKMKLNPEPGMNRGRVYVRDKISGSSKRIRVTVQVNEVIEPPRLELSEKKIDFGRIRYDAKPPKSTIRLNNLGGGKLEAKVTSLSDLFKVRLVGDFIEVTPNVSETGVHTDEILIESNGGNATIPVTAEIEMGPVLEINKEHVDFGTVKEAHSKSIKVIINNSGSAQLKWEYKKHGDFFTVSKTGDILKLTLNAQQGNYHGTLVIRSNGGDRTIDVRAKIKAEKKSTKKPNQKHLNISGSWNYAGQGIINITGSGSNYTYQDFNMLGVVVGEGSATVNGNKVSINGYNIMVGQILGQFEVERNLMSGFITSMGMNQPMTFTKVSNANIQGFNF